MRTMLITKQLLIMLILGLATDVSFAKKSATFEKNPAAIESPLTVTTEKQIPKIILSDASIVTAILKEYAENPLLSKSKINVVSHEGLVNLSGVVETTTQEEQAVTLAQAVSSVKQVDFSQLHVALSDEPMSDDLITAKIKELLLKYKTENPAAFSYWGIHVHTQHQIVYVTGVVSNQTQKMNTLAVIHSVKAVRDVKSNIQISVETPNVE